MIQTTRHGSLNGKHLSTTTAVALRRQFSTFGHERDGTVCMMIADGQLSVEPLFGRIDKTTSLGLETDRPVECIYLIVFRTDRNLLGYFCGSNSTMRSDLTLVKCGEGLRNTALTCRLAVGRARLGLVCEDVSTITAWDCQW